MNPELLNNEPQLPLKCLSLIVQSGGYGVCASRIAELLEVRELYPLVHAIDSLMERNLIFQDGTRTTQHGKEINYRAFADGVRLLNKETERNKRNAVFQEAPKWKDVLAKRKAEAKIAKQAVKRRLAKCSPERFKIKQVRPPITFEQKVSEMKAKFSDELMAFAQHPIKRRIKKVCPCCYGVGTHYRNCATRFMKYDGTTRKETA